MRLPSFFSVRDLGAISSTVDTRLHSDTRELSSRSQTRSRLSIRDRYFHGENEEVGYVLPLFGYYIILNFLKGPILVHCILYSISLSLFIEISFDFLANFDSVYTRDHEPFSTSSGENESQTRNVDAPRNVARSTAVDRSEQRSARGPRRSSLEGARPARVWRSKYPTGETRYRVTILRAMSRTCVMRTITKEMESGEDNRSKGSRAHTHTHTHTHIFP